MTEQKTIPVIGRAGDQTEERAMLGKLKDLFYERELVDAETLGGNLSKLLSALDEILANLPAKVGEFRVESMTVSVEVSAKGAVSLLGSGGEMAGKGGLTFALVRRVDEDNGGKRRVKGPERQGP